MVPDAPPPLHELESEVMEEMWGRSEATVREVVEALNRKSRQRAYTTLMTTMSRLWEKGLLARERRGRRDVYRSTLTREAYLDARAGAEVDALLEEFGDLAVSQFARRVGPLDEERIEKLRRLAEL